MKIFTWLVSCSIMLALAQIIPGSTHANEKLVHSKGMAEIRFDGGKPSKTQLVQADFQAKENSVQRYLTKYRPGVVEVYNSCATPLNAGNIDNVVIDSMSRPPKQRDGIYRVAMRTSIDTSRLDKYLQYCSGGVIDARIAIVLVAREKVSDKQQDVYKAFFGRLDKALADVFVAKNFTVDSKRDMELFSGGLYREVRLMEQYKSAGKVNWESAYIASDLNNIDLLVLGYFDIGTVEKVKINNMLDVTVSGSAEILDLRDKTVISSSSKIQRRAEAPSDSEVINEAVQLVVDEMGQQLTDKLIQYYMTL